MLKGKTLNKPCQNIIGSLILEQSSRLFFRSFAEQRASNRKLKKSTINALSKQKLLIVTNKTNPPSENGNYFEIQFRLVKKERKQKRRQHDKHPGDRWYGDKQQHPFYDPWFQNSTRGPEPRTKAGGKHTISLIPGIGVGREMMEKLVEVFECCGAPVGYDWIDKTSTAQDFENMVLSVKRNGVGVKGNIEDRHTADELGVEKSRNAEFRQKLDLFVNVTKCKSYPELKDRMRFVPYVDIVLIRSNTEGEYALLEHRPLENVVENLRLTTAYNSRRVAHYAFQYATAHGRKKITILHNVHLTPLSDKLFVSTVKDIALQYPKVDTEMKDFHTALKHFLINANTLDVVITNSLFCSQFIHILMGIIGSSGLLCGGNISKGYAVFEPATRERGVEQAKRGTSNPTAFLLAGAAALEVCGAQKHANYVRQAIQENFRNGVRTQDLGGTASTDEFISGVVSAVRRMTPSILCKSDPPPFFRNRDKDDTADWR